MQIRINQQRLSIGARYRISVDGRETHRAQAKLFRIFSEIELFSDEAVLARFVIKRRWDWFNAAFDLTRANGDLFELRTESFWRRHYSCQAGASRYDIYGHRGRKFSILKNDVQVAYWQKDLVAVFSGDNYLLVADDDSDADLLMAFCLAIDSYRSRRNRGAIELDFHIGPQARKFDQEWRPKHGR